VGTNGNISADPLFCDPDENDFRLADISACCEANSPCGELIGASATGCGPLDLIVVVNPEGTGDHPDIQTAIDELWGYINPAGKIVITPQFENADEFTDGLAAIKINSKWGYVNKAGHVVIEPNLDRVYAFQNGVALVRVDNQLKYIDKKGNTVWQFEE